MKKGTGPFFIFSGGETSFPKILTPIACRYILSLNESADTMKEASDKASVTIEELKQISEIGRASCRERV